MGNPAILEKWARQAQRPASGQTASRRMKRSLPVGRFLGVDNSVMGWKVRARLLTWIPLGRAGHPRARKAREGTGLQYPGDRQERKMRTE